MYNGLVAQPPLKFVNPALKMITYLRMRTFFALY